MGIQTERNTPSPADRAHDLVEELQTLISEQGTNERELVVVQSRIRNVSERIVETRKALRDLIHPMVAPDPAVSAEYLSDDVEPGSLLRSTGPQCPDSAKSNLLPGGFD